MRLSPQQRDAIVAAFRQAFGPGARLFLFGSRVDDSKRGGDIDLCVETPTTPWPELVGLRLSFETALAKVLGERKIDVVLRRAGDAPRAIDTEIDLHGIELCRIPS
jgi:predicted nucleotidyltransferase